LFAAQPAGSPAEPRFVPVSLVARARAANSGLVQAQATTVPRAKVAGRPVGVVAASRSRGARRGARRGSTLQPLLLRLCGAAGELDALPRAVSPAMTTAELLSSSCGRTPQLNLDLDVASCLDVVQVRALTPPRPVHCPRSGSHRAHASPPTFTLPIRTTPNPPTHPLLQSQRLKRRVRQRQEGSGTRGCGGGCVGARAVVGPSKLRLYVRCVCGRRSRGGRGGAAPEAVGGCGGAAAKPAGGCDGAAGGCASIPSARRSVGAVSTAERWRLGAIRDGRCAGVAAVSGVAAGCAAGGDRNCGASTSRTSAARAAAPRLGLHRARVERRRRFDRGTPQRLSGRLGTTSLWRASSSRCVRCPPASTASGRTPRIG
jgi:hypothetical protein